MGDNVVYGVVRLFFSFLLAAGKQVCTHTLVLSFNITALDLHSEMNGKLKSILLSKYNAV